MIRALLFTAALLCWSQQADAAPERVVSMNLCTDQLAMLVGPEQLISVSYLARDARASAMSEEAQAYPANRGLAEEIFLLRPDLVIAGTYTTRATVEMLRRLDVPVVEFAPANTLDDIRARLARMGQVLGRQEVSGNLIRQFDADLATAHRQSGPRPRAATYHANSYTSGGGTLADAVMEAAGLTNIAGELGLAGGGRLPLETLVMAAPDLIITGRHFGTPALAEAILAHPALHRLQTHSRSAPVADRDWTCGTPFVIAAIRRLAAARDKVLER